MTKSHVSAATLLTSLHTGNSIDTGKAGKMLALVRSGDKMNDMRTHALAVAAIYRSMPHADGGHLDCALAARLMNALGRRVRAKALAAWFRAYSNIVVLRDDKTGLWGAKLIGPTSKMYKAADPAAALIVPFWTVEEASTDPKAFDMGAALASLIKRAEKAGDNSDTLTALKALVPAE